MKKKVSVKPDVVAKPEVVFDYEATWKHICAMLPTYNGANNPIITVIDGKIGMRSAGTTLGEGSTLAEAMGNSLEFLRAYNLKILDQKCAELAQLRAAMGLAPEEK